jgi:antitoxin (DNA-binding transcriptional repressor) of toxin-antitoxin stability system
MNHIEIEDAEAIWFDLIARVEAGEAFLLTREGAPVASLTPLSGQIFGAMKGELTIGPEFFEPLPDEELDAWE